MISIGEILVIGGIAHRHLEVIIIRPGEEIGERGAEVDVALLPGGHREADIAASRIRGGRAIEFLFADFGIGDVPKDRLSVQRGILRLGGGAGIGSVRVIGVPVEIDGDVLVLGGAIPKTGAGGKEFRLKFGLLRHVRLGGIEAVRVDDRDENRHEGDGPEDDRAGNGGFVLGEATESVLEERRRLRFHLLVGKFDVVLA